MNLQIFAVAFICLLTGFGSILSAVEEIHKRGNYETPHTKWLSPTPFAAKPRVLFFTTYRSGAGRYAREMSDRFDLDYEQVLVYHGKIVGNNTGAARLEDLLNQRWDAFVFFEDSPTKLLAPYPKLYSMLLFQIASDGAGIILIDYTDHKVLKEKNLLPVPKDLASEGVLKASYYKVAKGFGVQIQGFDMTSPNYRDKYGYGRKEDALVVKYQEGWRDEYDAMFRQIGANLFWSMRKMLPVFRIDAKNDTACISGVWPEHCELDFYLTGGGERYELKKDSVPSGENAVSVPVPDLPPGKYHLNAIIRKAGKGYSFASEPLQIAGDKNNSIEKINFDNCNYAGDAGQTISGGVEYSGKGKITLCLRDVSRRILCEIPLKNTNGKAVFSFSLEDWMPSMMTLEATLTNSGKILDRKYEYCNKIIRRPRMFEFSAWGHPYSHNGVHDLNSRLAELGLTSLMMPGYCMRHSPWGIQDYQLNSAHVFDEIPGNDPNKCFFSATRRKRLTDRFKNYQRSYKTGMRIISLGDEVQEHYGCFAPDCLKRYREFLKDKYKGDLARLNRNWKTNYLTWDEVTLSWIPEKNQGRDLEKYVREFMGDDNRAAWNHLVPHYVKWLGGRSPKISDISASYTKKQQARRFWDNMFMDQEAGAYLEGNYARWIDRQDFKSYAYSETTRFLKDYFRKIDPYVLGGMEGTGGIDFLSHADRMVETQAWMGNYAEANNYNMMNEVSRSISPDDYISNAWVGYTTSPSMLCDRVWNEMFRRPSMIMFYTTTGDGMPSYHGIVRPDLSVFSAAGEMLRQTEKLRNGLGTSLLRSQSLNDPVAVLYSYPSSVFGARIYHGGTFDYARLSHNSAMDWIMSLGYSFRYVTDTRLENGKDDLNNYKILFLPRSCAVSDKLARQINDFVHNGGTVIADIRAGIMDEHLNLRVPGAFDQTAGLRRRVVLPASFQSFHPELKMNKVHIEQGIEIDGGTAIWKTEEKQPALIVKRHGKGKFVTLNFPFHELPSVDNAPQELLNVLKDAFSGIIDRPVFTVSENGAPIYNLRRGEWRNGEMLIMGVKSKLRSKFTVNAELPEAKYVFSIDGEKNLGKVSSFKFEINPPKPEFFILTDKPLPEIQLTVPGSVKRGSDLVLTYMVKGMKGERPLQLSYERNGKPVNLQTVREVSANESIQQIRFRIALNESFGKYTLKARDVYTGKITVYPISIH